MRKQETIPGRLLVIGDVHYTTTPPRSRTESYAEHVREKLSEVSDLAHKLQARVVCVGDFFHRRRTSLGAVCDMIDIFGSMPGGWAWGIVGNHDALPNSDIAHTGIGVLVRAGVVKLIEPHMLIDFVGTGTDDKHFVLTGHPYHPEQDTTHGWIYNRTAPPKEIEVRITHGMLVPTSSAAPPFDHTMPNQIPDPPQLLINGHNHHAFDAPARHMSTDARVGDIVNIGSIARTSRMQLGPRRVVFVCATQDDGLEWRSIPLASTRPDNDVFVEVESGILPDEQAREQRVREYAEALLSDGDTASVDPILLLDRVCAEDQQAAKELAKHYIESAQTALRGGK